MVMLSRLMAFLVFGVVVLSMDIHAADDKTSAVVKVMPSRTIVSQNEKFNVSFIIKSNGDVKSPDWSPLNKDFSLLSKNRSVREDITNGVKKTVYAWDVRLKPKRSGKLKIPSLQFGTAYSQVKEIQVKPPPKVKSAGPAKEFFIEVKAKPKNPYVQAQVLFTLKVFMLYGLRGSISPPKSDSKAIVENLGEARNSRVRRDGKSYEVYERKYLIYPQTSDDLKIKPVTLSGSYVKQGRRFTVNKKSREVTLKVQQVPSSFPGKFWLPAEKFNIKEKWSSDLLSWRAGEPVQRTLHLDARGLLAKQVPELDLSAADGFRFYPEPSNVGNSRVGDTIVGKRQQSAVLIPAQAGTYTLPAIKVPWWNTRADRLEFAELPEKKVTVGEAAFSTLTVDESSPVGTSGAESVSASSAIVTKSSSLWFWVSMVFLLGWVATVVVMWCRTEIYRLFKMGRQHKKNLKKNREEIYRACQVNDILVAKKALIEWAQMVWPSNPPISIGQIGARCGGMFEQQMRVLDRALYSKGIAWEGYLMWEVFITQDFNTEDKIRETDSSGLEPLHKL